MNRLLKLTQTEDRKVYVTSDTHWNHNPKWPVPLWKARGYGSVEESNIHQRDTINSIVRPNDILFHLGDVTLNCSEEQFESFIASLNCKTIYTLWGNHNNPIHKIYEREISSLWCAALDIPDEVSRNVPEIYPFKYKNIIFLGNYVEVVVNGIYLVMSHYPISSWNHMKAGSIHLFGHQHCNNNPQGGKQMDVGWDRDKRPYSISEIVEKMKSIPIVSDGGHH